MAHRARALSRGFLMLLSAAVAFALAQPLVLPDLPSAVAEAEAALAVAAQDPQSRLATPDDALWRAAITAADRALVMAEEARRADASNGSVEQLWQEALLRQTLPLPF